MKACDPARIAVSAVRVDIVSGVKMSCSSCGTDDILWSPVTLAMMSQWAGDHHRKEAGT